MQELIQDLLTDPARKRLVLMPVTRLLLHERFQIGAFHFFPAGSTDLAALRPVPNKNLDSLAGISGVVELEGQNLREVATSLTGFDLEVLSSSPLIAFNIELDWDQFLQADHDNDVSLLKLLSSKAERALDVIRLQYCRFDLPHTLPGPVGSWNGSGEYLGALVYSPEDHESYLIAGAAVECSVVVRGIGLEIDTDPQLSLPSAEQGEVAAIALHGLTLFSDAMTAPNETVKFVRAMTLLEFLASPDEYRPWKKLKGDIACHCAKDKAQYLALCERFRTLTSQEDPSGQQTGLRTLIVHHGKFLPELLPSAKQRASLFRELQTYSGKVLTDMLAHAPLSWTRYDERRIEIKRALGVS